MKRLNLLLFILFALPLSSMAQVVVTYSYDAAGNRTGRTMPIEETVINDSQAIGESNITEFDIKQVFINKDNMLCNVFKSNYGDVRSEEFFVKNHMENGHQFLPCSFESPVMMAQVIDTKQKRICKAKNI